MPVSAEFDFVAEGEKPIGSARLTYQATYYELLPTRDKQAGIGDFEKASIDVKVGHHDNDPDDQIELNDCVDIPQT